MNSSNFDQILRQVLLVPVLIILLGAGALYWQMHHSYLTVARLQTSDEAVTESETLETLMIDQETGLRGYQTTGDPRFLEPFRNSVNLMPGQFARLHAAAHDSHTDALVGDLETAYDGWKQGFADPLISSMAAGASTSDVELNLLGKRQMDGIRKRISAFQATARLQRDEYVWRWREQVRLMSSALLVLALVIGLIIGLYTRRQLQDVSNAYRHSHNTLRIRAEQAFRSEQKLRTTLQSIGDGVITCDADGTVETMNDIAQELTGWSIEEAHRRPLEHVFKVIDQGSHQPIENPVAEVKRLNKVVALATHAMLVRKDSSQIHINHSGAPIRDKQGAVIGVVLVFRDITMALKSQEALLANEKLAVAGRLAATIAHEIHNPLDSVANLLFLMDGESTPEESQQFLQLAKQEIARVTQISRAMLSLYRESKAPVAIDLAEMLNSILLLMERRFTSLGVTTSSDVPANLIIHGFPAELRQVFTNLLTNAAEASSPEGVIEIHAESFPDTTSSAGTRQEPGALVTISDHGPGVPPEIQASLFKPFFTTKGERGTGLGLWVSRGIMTKHGGSIDLASSTDAMDHGTTVSVFLATNPVINAGGD